MIKLRYPNLHPRDPRNLKRDVNYSAIANLLNMPTQPQAVTERYVSNLIHNGRNKEFDIINIDIHESKSNNEEVVGYYFEVLLRGVNGRVHQQTAAGATIAQATRRALEKHGVTFR